jgi:hypothetical protein
LRYTIINKWPEEKQDIILRNPEDKRQLGAIRYRREENVDCIHLAQAGANGSHEA